jgi:hypothetical protein
VCVKAAAEAKQKEEEERKTKEEEEKKRMDEEARAAAAAAEGDEYVLHNRLVCSVFLCFRLSVCLLIDCVCFYFRDFHFMCCCLLMCQTCVFVCTRVRTLVEEARQNEEDDE